MVSVLVVRRRESSCMNMVGLACIPVCVLHTLNRSSTRRLAVCIDYLVQIAIYQVYLTIAMNTSLSSCSPFSKYIVD